MSLEESMKELAESNTKLAKALNRYADVIETNGVGVVSQAAKGKTAAADEEDEPAPKSKGKAAAAAEKPAAKSKAKAAPADEDDDGLDSKPAPKGKAKKAITFDEVKAKLLEVKEIGGREAAAEIFGEYGYSSLNNVQEKDYQAIFDDAVKYLDDNAE